MAEVGVERNLLDRDPASAVAQAWDLIVIGGGFQGVALCAQAAAQGRRPLLVERDDFGQGVSANSLRVLHGGFRYLQTLDLVRLRESLFPDLVEPLECLMPLYGGLRGPFLFRIALRMARLFGESAQPSAPQGRVLDPEQTAELFPAVEGSGLRGGGVWHDAVMPSSERVLVEMLRAAAARGAAALNYTEATGLLEVSGEVCGVAARDRISGDEFELRAPRVFNCAGPATRRLAADFDRDFPELFPSAVLSFNLLLDRPAPSRAALAVSARRKGQTYFLLPWRGRVLAGTHESACPIADPAPRPRASQIRQMLAELNAAVPGLDASPESVDRVYWGLIPGDRDTDPRPSKRPTLVDHGRSGGVGGFYSVSGVKLTTARHLAAQALRAAFGRSQNANLAPERSGVAERAALPRDLACLAEAPDEATRQAAEQRVAAVLREEAVVHLDDLFLRRCHWEGSADDAATPAERVCELLDWAPERCAEELSRLRAALESGLPANEQTRVGEAG